jgi:hypothetical protein
MKSLIKKIFFSLFVFIFNFLLSEKKSEENRKEALIKNTNKNKNKGLIKNTNKNKKKDLIRNKNKKIKTLRKDKKGQGRVSLNLKQKKSLASFQELSKVIKESDSNVLKDSFNSLEEKMKKKESIEPELKDIKNVVDKNNLVEVGEVIAKNEPLFTKYQEIIKQEEKKTEEIQENNNKIEEDINKLINTTEEENKNLAEVEKIISEKIEEKNTEDKLSISENTNPKIIESKIIEEIEVIKINNEENKNSQINESKVSEEIKGKMIDNLIKEFQNTTHLAQEEVVEDNKKNEMIEKQNKITENRIVPYVQPQEYLKTTESNIINKKENNIINNIEYKKENIIENTLKEINTKEKDILDNNNNQKEEKNIKEINIEDIEKKNEIKNINNEAKNKININIEELEKKYKEQNIIKEEQKENKVSEEKNIDINNQAQLLSLINKDPKILNFALNIIKKEKIGHEEEEKTEISKEFLKKIESLKKYKDSFDSDHYFVEQNKKKLIL